jgi:nitrite reductase/ring-hydroxylating ferredoxin subunit
VSRGTFVAVGEHELAIFHLTDPERFIVTRNSCPHAGGNLAAGEIERGVVTCPWHQWAFDLESGRCTLSDTVRLLRYPAKVVDGFVCVNLVRAE